MPGLQCRVTTAGVSVRGCSMRGTIIIAIDRQWEGGQSERTKPSIAISPRRSCPESLLIVSTVPWSQAL
eukprot:scaffold2066_cov229-Ochromonas_danica.AAC.14